MTYVRRHRDHQPHSINQSTNQSINQPINQLITQTISKTIINKLLINSHSRQHFFLFHSVFKFQNFFYNMLRGYILQGQNCFKRLQDAHRSDQTTPYCGCQMGLDCNDITVNVLKGFQVTLTPWHLKLSELHNHACILKSWVGMGEGWWMGMGEPFNMTGLGDSADNRSAIVARSSHCKSTLADQEFKTSTVVIRIFIMYV